QAAADHVLSFNLRRVVITGGEPMLQQSALIDLIDHLRNADDAFHIEIETNGTIAPVAALAAKIDQYNVSPKLAHSGNADQLRLKSDVLAWYADIPHAYFKFVVAEETDLLEVDELIDRMALTRDRVFLMPEGVRSEVLRARARWLSDAALERGLRYSDRQHIHTHGDARGT
ncbi:MAG: 7-carboxy-7-deazaguanine synthase QueE, partial [Pseudomonadota bacterium]